MSVSTQEMVIYLIRAKYFNRFWTQRVLVGRLLLERASPELQLRGRLMPPFWVKGSPQSIVSAEGVTPGDARLLVTGRVPCTVRVCVFGIRYRTACPGFPAIAHLFKYFMANRTSCGDDWFYFSIVSYIKAISLVNASRVLSVNPRPNPHSTGDSTRYSGMVHVGKRPEEAWMWEYV